MHLTRLTACGLIVVLAACHDAPVAPMAPSPAELSAKGVDLSKVTILKPSEYAAHAVERSMLKSSTLKRSPTPRANFRACEIDNPYSCPPDEPPVLGVAHVDYYSWSDTSSYANLFKYVQLNTFAEAHDNMYSTVLDAYYYVGGGCGPANEMFAQLRQIAYGSPVHLEDSRFMYYDFSSVFTWRVDALATYTANYGYVVDGVFIPSIGYPSGHTVCL